VADPTINESKLGMMRRQYIVCSVAIIELLILKAGGRIMINYLKNI
jgi:hypothetical protein